MSDSMKKWVTVWGNAISIAERRPENYAKNLTLRYPVCMMLDGSALRITLDNFCGSEPVTLTAATIAPSDEQGVLSPDAKPLPLTFNCGSPTVTIPAGESVVSDAVSCAVKKGGFVSISLYFSDFTEMRSGVLITGPLSRGFFAIGDQTTAAVLPQNDSKKTNWFYFLSNIDVLADEDCHTVICYGDSITAQAWPDHLMLQTLKHGDGKTAVIRKAASGTRILRQYDNITYDSYGLKGDIRFPHEIPSVSGADTIIIQHGINDIIHPVGTEVNPFRPWSDLPTAEEMIAGLTAYQSQAKALGLRVFFGTLLPIEGWRTYAPFRNELRCAVNAWIRSQNCVDFDMAVCDPENPAAFAAAYDSGDHLHPSAAAYQKMAETAFECLEASEKNMVCV